MIIPKVNPMKVKSLCQGKKKFLRRSEIERLSSMNVEILESILKCHKGILTYHQYMNSLVVYVKITKRLSTLLSLRTFCPPLLVNIFVCSIP